MVANSVCPMTRARQHAPDRLWHLPASGDPSLAFLRQLDILASATAQIGRHSREAVELESAAADAQSQIDREADSATENPTDDASDSDEPETITDSADAAESIARSNE